MVFKERSIFIVLNVQGFYRGGIESIGKVLIFEIIFFKILKMY